MRESPVNVDAYRAAAEALQQTRALIRRELERLHGRAWEERGLPEPVRGFLLGRRERETGIMWRLPEIVDLLDYAGFANLHDIVADTPALVALFRAMLPDPTLLRTRFLELDVVLNRVAFARPLSPVELEFLHGFAQRLAALAASQGIGPAEGGAAPHAEASPAAVELSDERLRQALRKGDGATLMAALYQEVTAAADAVWTSAALPPLRIWPEVAASQWFRGRAASGELARLVEFYGRLDEARALISAGAPLDEVQELLRTRRFAQLLMALREVFKLAARD